MTTAGQEPLKLVFVLHCHQPVGNFDEVFARACDEAYEPFLNVLASHPSIHVGLHYSGCLLDWIEEHRPAMLDRIGALIQTGQVEPLTGGYYEPILPLIPERDRVEQIQRLTRWIDDRWGVTPEGLWLAERVWEPDLPRTLASAGVTYTIVDDYHFQRHGGWQGEVYNSHVTEEGGDRVDLFASSRPLRYAIPFQDPEDTLTFLRQARSEGARGVTFADDGEKFGLWPGTHRWVYEEGWLEKFLSQIEHAEGIEMVSPREYRACHEPSGLVYLPTASYEEMMEWSGGFFRNFLTRYSESNAMHKRMLEVSDQVHRALDVSAKRQAKALEQPLEVIERLRSEAQIALQRGQCNCAYWHGVFGGLYLAHLRDAVYRQLLQGDQLAEQLLNENGKIALEWDQDQDGQNEVVLRSSTWKAYVDPQDGGCVYELDFRPAAANLTNTLTRRPEAYHERLREAAQPAAMAAADQHEDGPPSIHQLEGVKEAGLAQQLQYDAHRRVSMVDRLLRPEHDVTSFVDGQADDAAGGLTPQFDVVTSRRKPLISAQLSREDRLLREGYQHPFSITKTVALDEEAGTVQLCWKLENLGEREYSVRYGTEWNLAVFDPELNAPGSSGAIERLTLTDQWHQLKVTYEFDRSTELWYYPVSTVSESEGGIESTPQGVCLLFHWIVRLGPRGTWQAKATLSAETT